MGIDDVMSGRSKWCVVHGDVREVLKTLPTAAFDFCLSDVPYGLGAREPTAEEIIAYLQGEELDTRGDFMGRRWSIPSVGVWLEVMRCLKPGAHVFSFGGTRTWDLISLGLRAAGFENRDTIAEDYPALRWDYGSGFPKSLDVSKAIEAQELTGGSSPKHLADAVDATGQGIPSDDGIGLKWDSEDGTRQGVKRHESGGWSATNPNAQQWAGYGTALKPSWEPVLVFRKPLDGTVAANVLKHGCGALNVDACRVGTGADKGVWPVTDREKTLEVLGDFRGHSETDTTVGRFPPNAVLIHAEGCVRVGRKKVAAGNSISPSDSEGATWHRDQKTVGPHYASPDGTETVDDWHCVDGCPAKALAEQSDGCHSAGYATDGVHCAGTAPSGGVVYSERGAYPVARFGDTGSAARFFPQFQAEAPFKYVGKASRAEREFGCEHLPARKSVDVTGRDEDAAGQNNPRSGSRKRGEIRNTGPCVKPQEFLRWLVRLGCRPGGIVLVHYCGTGSEIIACVGAGMRAIGIEGDAEMVAIANARCAAWEMYPEGVKPAPVVERERLEARGQLSLLDMAG